MRLKWGALESASLRRKSESSVRKLLNRRKTILKQWTYMNLVRNRMRKILSIRLMLLALDCSNLFKSEYNVSYVRYEVLRAVVMKSSVFWDKPKKLLWKQMTNRALLAACFHADFVLGLFFDPEDGDDMFLRNVCCLFNGLHGVISQKIILLSIMSVTLWYFFSYKYKLWHFNSLCFWIWSSIYVFNIISTQ
jgi:hypothetical protein